MTRSPEIATRAEAVVKSVTYNAVNNAADDYSLYIQAADLASLLGAEPDAADRRGFGGVIIQSGLHAGDLYVPGYFKYGRSDHVRGLVRTIGNSKAASDQQKAHLIDTVVGQAARPNPASARWRHQYPAPTTYFRHVAMSELRMTGVLIKGRHEETETQKLLEDQWQHKYLAGARYLLHWLTKRTDKEEDKPLTKAHESHTGPGNYELVEGYAAGYVHSGEGTDRHGEYEAGSAPNDRPE